ncbi:MAG: efflux RND transporter periplasmic adaptor subunit [Bacteroidota bacterium]
MRNIFILLGLILIAGCNPSDEQIKKRIIQKKEKINQIEKQINDLEKELSDTTKKDEAIPVEIMTINPEEFTHYIIAYGEVEAQDYAQVMPEVPGRIETIHIDEGQWVYKGQLLISLNTESIESSTEQIESNLDLARETFEKQKNLWEQNIGSEIQYLQAKAQKESLESQLKSTKAQLRMSQIRAPFAGYVDKVFLREGELASQMAPVLEMVNIDDLSVTVDISEKYIGDIEKGQLVAVTFSNLPELEIEVPVERVAKVINAGSRTFEVEVLLENSEQKIKPYMVSTLRIKDFSSDEAFVIPSLIIKNDITGNYVYVAKEENGQMIAQKKYIETGLSYEDETMVTSGLDEGDKVIVRGFNLVNSGIPVRIQ